MKEKFKVLIFNGIKEFGYNVADFNEIKSSELLKQWACGLLRNNLKYDLNPEECQYIEKFILEELT